MSIVLKANPSGLSLFGEILRDRFAHRSIFDRLACRFNYHRKIKCGNVEFCGSCFTLIIGDKNSLEREIVLAEFREQESRQRLVSSVGMSLAYENECGFVNVADLMTIQMLKQVRDHLPENQ